MVECLPSMHEALGSTVSTGGKAEKRKDIECLYYGEITGFEGICFT